MPDPQQVRVMFDRIAGRYDMMNRVMTMGIDTLWRREAVRQADVPEGGAVLDACCGTGDLTFMLARAGAARTVGVDFSARMLEQARRRVGRRPARETMGIEFVEADVLELPFGDDSFDAVTVGFGVRNVADLARAFEEFRRVTRPGGNIVCLEITRPDGQPFEAFYELWFDRVVPHVGGLLAGDRDAYTYLPESTRHFPKPPQLARVLEAAGLVDVGYRTFAGGIVALHVGSVPAADREPAAVAVR